MSASAVPNILCLSNEWANLTGIGKIGVTPMFDPLRGVTIASPGVYQIIVQGQLETRYSERLAGMQITHRSWEDGTDTTILTGSLRDQAELSGVLNTLYDLHLPVLSVDLLRSPSESKQRGANSKEN
jgi:hypothetical protein